MRDRVRLLQGPGVRFPKNRPGNRPFAVKPRVARSNLGYGQPLPAMELYKDGIRLSVRKV